MEMASSIVSGYGTYERDDCLYSSLAGYVSIEEEEEGDASKVRKDHLTHY